ncbi:MAG: M23 family metallopeptidase [Akkermansiaceae bacterium]
MSKNSKQPVLLTCFLVAAIVSIIGITLLSRTKTTNREYVAIKSMASWQHADAPLGFNVDGISSKKTNPLFDHRFIQLSAFEKAALPTVQGMHHALGSAHGALTYNAQAFWRFNEKRGGYHTGDDLNGIGGMNTDLGDPIYAISHGQVIYRGEPSPGWGKTLIIAHKKESGEVMNTMYAHLKSSYPALGDSISKDEIIGKVGTANGLYLAHLHLEIRNSSGVHIGNGYCRLQGECQAAEENIVLLNNSSADQLYPSVAEVILQNKRTSNNHQFQF